MFSKRTIALFFYFILFTATAVLHDFVNATEEVDTTRLKAITNKLRCLQCQSQAISESDAPFAKDIKQVVENRIRLGESDKEIIGFLVSRYGEFILLKPKLTLTTSVLWFGPFILLILSLLWNWRRIHYHENRMGGSVSKK